MLTGLGSDLRFGLRFYRRNPGFAALAVAILAVGIGSTTALFSVVDAVLLRPLPFAAPESLVNLWEDYSHHGLPRNTPAAGNFTDWKAQARSFTDLAASNQHAASLTGDGRPEAALGRRVTENLFDVLGVKAALGRTLGAQDAAGSGTAEPVVVISDGLWRRRFGAEPGVVGRTLRLDGLAHTIIGVMPRRFAYPTTRHDYWVPARWSPEQAASRRSHNLQVVARLRPEVTLEEARAEMALVAERIANANPENAGRGVVVVPLAEDLVGQSRSTLPVLLAAAGLLLLIGCANVANLLLAKAVGRGGEMALRQALGAGRGRLLRQTLVESLLLGLAAGALGVLFARLALGLVERLVPLALAGVPVRLDGRVLLLALGLSLATALLFGIAPAAALAADPWRRLGRGVGARGAAGGLNEGRLRDLMVVAEVALALVLLVGAGLAVRSLAALTAVDIGFRSERLLTLSTRLPRTTYAEPSRRAEFYERVLERVRALPGVERAAYTSNLPFTSRGNSTGFTIEGRPLREGEAPDALYRVATADYLGTIGLRLLEGRFYDASDSATSEPVAVINETMRRRFFEASPLGRRLRIGNDTWRTIVGVVADAKETGLEGSARSGVYLPVVQNGTAWAIPEYLVVRTAGDPVALAPALREVIWSVDPEQPISELREMQGWVDRDLAERRGQRGILSAFSGLALGLAALGIYGVLAYTVSRRKREIGVRMALGATPRDVAFLIGRSGMRLVVAGLAIGTAVALVATRLMSASLYQVRPSDPLTYIGVLAILAAVGAAAALLPTRQATAIEPANALRDD